MSKSVRTYGMTISSMYHDVISSDGDLEGLIIGSVKKKIDNIIEDEVEKELLTKVIVEKDIVDFFVTGSNYSFYNPKGHINETKINDIMNNFKDYKLLGWFKCRKGLPLRPTMVDHILYESFVNYCKNSSDELYNPYLMLITNNDENLFLQFEYKLLEQRGNGFNDVPLTIINLMSSSKKEYNEFIESSYSISEEGDDTPQKMYKYMNELNSMTFPPESVSLIENILDSALDDMRSLSRSIAKSEEELMMLKSKSKKISPK